MKRGLKVAWGVGSLLVMMAAVSAALAQQATGGAPVRAESWSPSTFISAIIATIVFGFIGILMAILGFKLFDALTPFHLEGEICEKQNLAVAILCAAMVLGICLIIAAAILPGN
jgi:putative membrane protein